MTRQLRHCALFALLLWVPLAVHADSCEGPTCVTIYNSDGTFTTNAAQTSLSLMGSGASMLYGVTGLGMGYDCAGLSGAGSCSGAVTLQTGNIIPGGTGNTLVPITGRSTWLGGGPTTAFDVTENAGNGLDGFTFSGMFSTVAGANSWSCVGTCTANRKNGVLVSVTGTWILAASIVNGVITIGGKAFDVIGAATVQLTTQNGTVAYKSGQPLVFTDNSGTSTFPAPVPEPSTLSLFGAGLIAIGYLVRRRLGSSSHVVPASH